MEWTLFFSFIFCIFSLFLYLNMSRNIINSLKSLWLPITKQNILNMFSQILRWIQNPKISITNKCFQCLLNCNQFYSLTNSRLFLHFLQYLLYNGPNVNIWVVMNRRLCYMLSNILHTSMSIFSILTDIICIFVDTLL